MIDSAAFLVRSSAVGQRCASSQYDTLALNMRMALPNASMMGFTGTPLIAGEEQATREQFGDYVSIYSFRDAIEDGATVPLYGDHRHGGRGLAESERAEDA
jgi:type I site-specific restriction-modification system R (restriction) subunit